MGLFDKFDKDEMLEKMKGKVSVATQSLKDKTGEIKANVDAKKAERTGNAEQLNQEMIDAISTGFNGKSIFDGIDVTTLISFTNTFYDKLFFPASSMGDPRIFMSKTISQKQLEKFAKINSQYNNEDTPLIYFSGDGKNTMVLSDKALYYALDLAKDTKYLAIGKIPVTMISDFSFVRGCEGSAYEVSVNNRTVLKWDILKGQDAKNKTLKEDFISLVEYFRRLANKDFDITAEQEESFMISKIEPSVVEKVKKYMVYDNERILYWCWGCDTGVSRDFVVCTNEQILVAEREIIYTSHEDIKQFFYDDIVSASVEQNSNSADLTGFLIETALTASTKTADLFFVIAGGKLKIKTLRKVEGDKIVEIVNELRKNRKNQATAMRNNQNDAPQVDVVEQIKKLKDLVDMGILSEDEFNQKKAELLSKM